MARGGVIVLPRDYFPRIQEVLRRYDIPFIADEVIWRFGCTGNMFGCETFGIKPDIMTVAKALSSAHLPISATIISEEIADAMTRHSGKLGNFAHGFTYAGHPVSAAVAVETLKIYEERDILAEVRKVGPYLQEIVKRLPTIRWSARRGAWGRSARFTLLRTRPVARLAARRRHIGSFIQQRAMDRWPYHPRRPGCGVCLPATDHYQGRDRRVGGSCRRRWTMVMRKPYAGGSVGDVAKQVAS